MITVCTRCANHEYIGRTDIDVWYVHYCKASPLPEMTNPVTGAKAYQTKNDFGTVVFVDEPYHFCRDINTDGNCSKYYPKG